MNILHVISASAGSGKTHFLTGFFLKQIFRIPDTEYFKRILAVTFTNKATAEMKARIIDELHQLASGKRSDYLSMLSHQGIDETLIRNKAERLLQQILHDYSWLSIETIDSFFQRVIRAFTRELGIPGNYSIELDVSTVLEYAVDQLLDNLGDDEDLLSWLMQFAGEKIADGKAWDFRSDLLDLGQELFKEQYSGHSNDLETIIGDREQMKLFSQRLFRIRDSFQAACSGYGKKGLDTILKHHLSDADFFQKKNGAIKIFGIMQRFELITSSGELFTGLKVMDKLLESAENWASADTNRKDEVTALAERELLPILTEAVDFISREYPNYKSATTLIQHMYSLGIMVDLAERVKQYRFEKNSFILSDAPVLIDKLINHNDTPFIYEKMGNRYAHYLIDEFQDTSQMQWKNFKPLISNSLSQGKECLLVGDVKQSIYRWRNGEWEILAKQIFEEYPADVVEKKSLGTNWRSYERVVSFNSLFFSEGAKLLKKHLENKLNLSDFDFFTQLDLLSGVYKDVIQDIPEKSRGKGNVQVQFFSKNQVVENPHYYNKYIIDTVNELLSLNYEQRDIAILVRDKAKGTLIADLIIQANQQQLFKEEVNIITDESLRISSSGSVGLLVSALKFIHQPQEPLYRAELISFFQAHTAFTHTDSSSVQLNWEAGITSDTNFFRILPESFQECLSDIISLPLYELIERLIQLFSLLQTDANLVYLHAFLDLVHDYLKAEEGTISSFLDYWEAKGRLKSIPGSDSQQAIRIQTIHKSKGLEYRAVILPFCDWSFDQKTNSVFWVNIPDSFDPAVPVFPVNYSKSLRDTHFSKDYYTEYFRSHVDNLNLLYVALTRAKESLYAFPVYGETEKRKQNIETVGDLLYDTLVKSGEANFGDYYNQESQIFRVGEFEDDINITKTPSGNSDDQYIKPEKGSQAMERLFFSTTGLDYFDTSHSKLQEKKLRGKTLHEILSRIVQVDDVGKELLHAVLEGAINKKEADDLEHHIRQCLQNPGTLMWFDGSGEVLTECDILLPGGSIRRPDRVIIYKDRVHVVDYKFGTDKDEEKHRIQVYSYIQVLLKMGYQHVEGFIWYIDMNEVITV